ncbi:MAG: outer membrane lipoprotein LolB [Gammaproteobacteria bacterium]|jgi:outer membrane lipoprotein LolB
MNTLNNRKTIDISPEYIQLPNQEKLTLMSHWELTGKIAIITPNERKSAYLNWQQANQVVDFRLTNLIGVSLLNLTYDGETAQLETDGKEYQDQSTEALVYRTTGWILPLDNLPQWIKGSVNAQDQVMLNDQGLPYIIQPICATCTGWEITYSQYEYVHGIWLPFLVEVNNPIKQTRLKFKVSQWQRK